MSGSQIYHSRKGDEKTALIMGFMDVTHHWIMVISCTYMLYISCGNEDGMPWLTEKGGSYTSLNSDKRWGFFKDDICFMEVNKGYAMILSFTLGYLIWGYILL